MEINEIITELESIQAILLSSRYKNPDNFISKKEVKGLIKFNI